MGKLDRKYCRLVEACLRKIEEEMERLYWNMNQRELDSPFRNTGAEYKDGTFYVSAYKWTDDDDEDEYIAPNFIYKGLKVWWYKNLGRDLHAECDKEITVGFLAEMIEDCFKSMREQIGEPE